MSYIGRQPVPQATRYQTEGIVDSPTHVIHVIGGYGVDNIHVYINGSLASKDEYTAEDGVTVTFNEELLKGTKYLIEEYRTFEPSKLNADNLLSGTVPNARLPATATRWPAWGEVTGKPATFTPSTHSHAVTWIAGTTWGPAISVQGGTAIAVPAASGTASGIVTTDAQTFAGNKTFTGTISGNGSGLTDLNASNLASGTVPAARLPSIATPIPAGTVMLFQQTFAPTGWTKLTTHNNKALRVVSGTASAGGSNSFTNAFNTARATSSGGSHAHSVTVNNHTLSVSEMPSHKHDIPFGYGGNRVSNRVRVWEATNNTGTFTNMTSAGGSGAHNHSASSASAGSHSHSLNLNVAYVDVIFAEKD